MSAPVERQAGQIAAMRSALEEVVAKCPACGGEGVEYGPGPGASFGPNQGLDVPCHWCERARNALDSNVGRLEAAVIRAAREVRAQADGRWTLRSFRDAVLRLFDRVDELNSKSAKETP